MANVIKMSSQVSGLAKRDAVEQRRFERLVDELEAQLIAHDGYVVYDVPAVDDVDRWRRAARAAGRRLGLRIRTGVAEESAKVWATEV
jgi:hypothetical protein